jgi:glycosyltransferase involved in cell wall biosynthesis
MDNMDNNNINNIHIFYIICMISILLPIYNGIEFLDESITSIIKQDFTEWELLIGINGHPPNSDVYKIAKKYEDSTCIHCGKIKVYDFPHLRGKSDTLNLLITYCKYDWISLMDVDDIWEKNKLQCQVQFMNGYDVIGTRAIYFGDYLNGVLPAIPYGDITNHDFHSGNPIINSSCLIRKEYSFWNKENDGVEDYELWLKLRSEGKRFYNCEEIAVKHRLHFTSAFNTQNHDNKLERIKNKYK